MKIEFHRLALCLCFFAATLLSVGCALASQPIHCSTLATGKWKVVSYRMDAVTAVSRAEAKLKVGKKVSVDSERVVFDGKICSIKSIATQVASGTPGYPYAVDYRCSEKIYIPTFFVGESCQKILAGIDGVTYTLTRVLRSAASRSVQ